MTLYELIDSGDFILLNHTDVENRPIASLRCGDLLSWVMAKGRADDAWITVQSHANIVAVATLLDMTCIILPEGAKPDPDTLEKADENGLAILSTGLDAFRIFLKMHALGLSA